MAKVRSPNYPVISLGEALPRIRMVFDRENRHPAAREVIAKGLGYGGLNGASLGLISALIKYGLLEQTGDQLKVSPIAMDLLLHEPGSPERLAAARQAAFLPVLFQEVHDTYGDTLPSDTNLRAYLIKKGFNPKSVDGVIRSYRDTMTFLAEESALAGSEAEDEPEHEEQMQTLDRTETARNRHDPPPDSGERGREPAPSESELRFRIAENAEVRAIFKGTVTQQAIRKFIALLEESADTFPAAQMASPQPPSPPAQPAAQRANGTASGLTADARAFLGSIDGGSVPAFMTDNLRRIAGENGVRVAPDTTPNQIIDELRRLA